MSRIFVLKQKTYYLFFNLLKRSFINIRSIILKVVHINNNIRNEKDLNNFVNKKGISKIKKPEEFANFIYKIIAKKNTDDNKKLIILYPSVLQSYFKYNIPNKYLLNNLVIEGIPQKNYRYFKFVLNIFVNLEFVIRRFLLFFLNLFKIKLSEQFRFPLVGIIQIFVNNNNFEENILSTNLNFLIDLEDEKNIESEKYLKSMGISKNDKFVCIHVRDSLYYDDDQRRSFRNSSLENYKDLIEHLIENNYHVIRLGVKNKFFEFKHKKFLDYSTFKNKKDFLELYLIKNCSFFIGTQSGPVVAPAAVQGS